VKSIGTQTRSGRLRPPWPRIDRALAGIIVAGAWRWLTPVPGPISGRKIDVSDGETRRVTT
jgi:hypothetical protein